MEYTYQFFSGGYEAGVKDCAADVVLDKLYQKFGFGDVIIGWNTQDKCYQRIIEVAHKAGKKVWLWMPVFSELPSYAKADPVIDYQNKLQQGLGVLPDEDFRFVCPSSQNNIDIIFNLYQKHFADLPFDGVFLDKIRHSSYANGLSGGMGCFCKNCTKIYQEEGVNTQEVINKINKSPAKLLPLSQINGKYIFKDPLVDNFYQAKADIITESILKLVIRFENSGLSVALDLFAPVLAYLVGQDIPELSKNVDFIKPMFYRITNAPAGIPFELKGYLDSFKAVNVDATGVLEKCWLQDNLCSDVAFERQLFLLYNKETRPGIEVNIVDGICDNTPEYVSQSINVLKRTGFSEPVLSWNLLNDVGSNLDVL